jgi:transposase
MEKHMGWALGPEVDLVEASLAGGGWLVSAVGRGDRRCPDCAEQSSSRHSWHYRRLQDLPLQGTSVAVKLRLGRWRCRNRRCGRQTFVEQLPAIAARLARRTHRVAELVRLFGHSTGGRPAERLMKRLAIPASNDTILRHLKRHVAKNHVGAALRVVGIDDWSWRKGSTCGSIMIDLEQRQVVDVLADRSAQGTAEWLEQHPEIEIVSRDRCGLYAQGARRGAPHARQVADRFHLLHNLRQTIEQQLSRAQRPVACSVPRSAGSDVTTSPPVTRGRSVDLEVAEHCQLAREGRRALRLDMFDRVKALQTAGESLRAIVHKTGFNWRTVAKWARQDALPERNVMAPKPTTPTAFQDHLARRWAEGCTTGRHLLPEIKHLGYTGSLSHLQRLLSKWRHAEPTTTTPTPAAGEVPASTAPIIPPNVAAALCMKPRGLLTALQADKVDRLKIASTEFATMRQLAMRFRSILRNGDIGKFDGWLRDAHDAGIYGIRRFVRTLRQDLAAVKNAITEPWSNGQAEGQINRLKTLKRAMYGRAGVELLRARMLPFQPSSEHAV